MRVAYPKLRAKKTANEPRRERSFAGYPRKALEDDAKIGANRRLRQNCKVKRTSTSSRRLFSPPAPQGS